MNILTQVKSLVVDAPMGDIPWSERVWATEQLDDVTRIKVYADGWNLDVKSEVERQLNLLLKKSAPSTKFQIMMGRRDKVTNPPPAAATTSTPAKAPETRAPSAQKPIPGVKRIIAVASGKGGVGKSTVSLNLAVALSNQGYKVGLLDADIYGPSQTMMMGLNENPKISPQNKMIPPEKFGIKMMSFGYFASEETAVIWRGPMVMKALQQFFYDVEWGELDMLVIDLPPGTGDAQLTLVQSLPISGAVIVTTPQNVALLDAVKGIVMFQKTNVPLLGIVENMASHHCPACGHESHIFGSGGADRVAERHQLPVLGYVPLLPDLRASGDEGVPLTTKPGHPVRVRFAEIAEKVVERLVALRAL